MPAKKRGLTDEDILELIEFLGENIPPLQETVQGSFKKRVGIERPFGNPTRFSDGNWPVLYAAIEKETAQDEIRYHRITAYASSEGRERTVFYNLIALKADGQGYDLRPRIVAWPDLVGSDPEKSYPFCQQLSREAIAQMADALLAPSARRLNGTTVPILRPEAVMPIASVAISAFVAQPDGSVIIRE